MDHDPGPPRLRSDRGPTTRPGDLADAASVVASLSLGPGMALATANPPAVAGAPETGPAVAVAG
jgi:hypothetical protein